MIILLNFVDNAIYAQVTQVVLEPVHRKANPADNWRL
jgi:hypothetical protein